MRSRTGKPYRASCRVAHQSLMNRADSSEREKREKERGERMRRDRENEKAAEEILKGGGRRDP